jgi:hypothetical protein
LTEGLSPERSVRLIASPRAMICVLVCGLTAGAPVFAGAWCDVVFKDVAHEADVVLLGRVEKAKGGPTSVHVVEVLKGDCGRRLLELDAADLAGLKHDDHVLVALDGELRPLRGTRTLGFCEAISVLPIRGRKLRGRDRLDYDSRSTGMSLEELRDELRRDLGDDSKHARLSGRCGERAPAGHP